MCKFITDLFLTNVGLVLTVCLRAKRTRHFRNDTEKKCLNFMFFSRIPFLSPKFEFMPNWLSLWSGIRSVLDEQG